MSKSEDIDYTPAAIEDVRTNVLIVMRDRALEANAFDITVGLTWAIAYLADYKEILEGISDEHHDRT